MKLIQIKYMQCPFIPYETSHLHTFIASLTQDEDQLVALVIFQLFPPGLSNNTPPIKISWGTQHHSQQGQIFRIFQTFLPGIIYLP